MDGAQGNAKLLSQLGGFLIRLVLQKEDQCDQACGSVVHQLSLKKYKAHICQIMTYMRLVISVRSSFVLMS
jgi:hypothetical protein